MSYFRPAGDVIGMKHRVRSVVISDDSFLPSGEYAFIDHYCTDTKCDCRKTIIQVLHDGELVSVISYGWESPKYYCEWMGMGADDDIAKEMSGVSIDMNSPDKVSRDGMLILFNHLLDDTWIGIIKDHYKMVRTEVRKSNG